MLPAILCCICAECLDSIRYCKPSPELIAETVEERKQQQSKSDLKRFTELRKLVKLWYAEVVDYSEYEPQIEKMLNTHMIVHFWNNDNAQKEVVNAIDDFLFDVIKGERGVELAIDKMDELIEKLMTVARHHSGI